jgi:Protein of unknown function (DUF2652)
MENKGLLFIPDISGFTRFVNETEIDHSRFIIQELLELLINANQIGLEVSEIEGDAILFYKFGASPDLKALYKQVEEMFCAFHRHLIAYEHRRFCHCQACLSAINLTLKVITHYGEFTSYQVRNFSKLIGKDIIVAHQLLKNDIEQHEYWLVTKSLLPDTPPVDLAEWMKWNSSAKQTETGEIPFHYTQLSQLKKGIQPEPYLKHQLANKVKVLSVAQEYETDLISLFHAVGDFNNRSYWQQGVKAVEEVSHILPRVGMQCRCIMEDGQTTLFTTSYLYQPEKVEFSETDEENKTASCYTLDATGPNKTRLTLDLYQSKNLGRQLLFKLLQKKKTEASYRQSLSNLETFVKQVHLPAPVC